MNFKFLNRFASLELCMSLKSLNCFKSWKSLKTSKSFLFISMLSGTLLLLGGCPKSSSTTPHTSNNQNKNGTSGETKEGNIGAETLEIPDKLEELIVFAKKHSQNVDSFPVQKAALDAVKKGLEKDQKNTELLLVGMKTAIRLGVLSETHAKMGEFGELARKWGVVGMAEAANRVEFPYYRAMGMAMKLQAQKKGALDKLPKVVELAQKAISLDEKYDYAGPLRFLGALYVQAPEMGSIGDKDKGITILEKAVAHFPEYPINQFFLGEAYFKDEQYDKAKAMLKKVQNAERDAPWSPRDRDWYQKKAKSYMRLIERKEKQGFGV